MKAQAHLAIDLGAESGRGIIGVISGGSRSERLALHDIHRFSNQPRSENGGLFWNFGGLCAGATTCLSNAAIWASQKSLPLASLGVDSWGVDFMLMGGDGKFLSDPMCYRDPRHSRGLDLLTINPGLSGLFTRTGVQPMAINTVCQLASLFERDAATRRSAKRLLWMPDLLHHFFSGILTNEATIASTSQLLTADGSGWATDLFDIAGIPRSLVDSLIAPGTTVGPVCDDFVQALDLQTRPRVIAPASHDTASAIAAVPAEPGSNWCYLSSGTWSLMGVELQHPNLTPDAMQAGFTNERGVANTIRFHRNLTGLWILQECRRENVSGNWPKRWDGLTEMAATSAPFRTRLNTQDAAFSTPGHMAVKIARHALSHEDPTPNTPGELARCCLEGLAMQYRRAILSLETLLSRPLDVIHVIGGGSQNALLNQMTADATGKRVVAGPAEATAAGNVLVQGLGTGIVRDIQHLRAISRASFERIEYLPRDTAAWDKAAAWYGEVL